jgi:hypothetical protein
MKLSFNPLAITIVIFLIVVSNYKFDLLIGNQLDSRIKTILYCVLLIIVIRKGYYTLSVLLMILYFVSGNRSQEGFRVANCEPYIVIDNKKMSSIGSTDKCYGVNRWRLHKWNRYDTSDAKDLKTYICRRKESIMVLKEPEEGEQCKTCTGEFGEISINYDGVIQCGIKGKDCNHTEDGVLKRGTFKEATRSNGATVLTCGNENSMCKKHKADGTIEEDNTYFVLNENKKLECKKVDDECTNSEGKKGVWKYNLNEMECE